jgi:hypothetical protein
MFWASGTSFDNISDNSKAMGKMAKNLIADNTFRWLIGATVCEVDDAIAGEVKRFAFKVCKQAESLTPKLGNISVVLELLWLGGEKHRRHLYTYLHTNSCSSVWISSVACF